MESTSEHLSAEALSLLCGFTLIDSAPSIDIVRCKECKHRYTSDCFRAYLEYDIQEWVVDSGDDNDYCSWGVRKDDE